MTMPKSASLWPMVKSELVVDSGNDLVGYQGKLGTVGHFINSHLVQSTSAACRIRNVGSGCNYKVHDAVCQNYDLESLRRVCYGDCPENMLAASYLVQILLQMQFIFRSRDSQARMTLRGFLHVAVAYPGQCVKRLLQASHLDSLYVSHRLSVNRNRFIGPRPHIHASEGGCPPADFK